MNGNKKIKDLPLTARPREKALHYGISTLSTQELLALLIGKGTREANALTLAHNLLDTHVSLTNLFKITQPNLLIRPGIGQVKALTLVACFELAKRLETTSDELSRPYDEVVIGQQYAAKLGYLTKETLFLLHLDRRQLIIKEEQLYIGNEQGFVIDTKEIIRSLLLTGASAFVLIHNHPSGLAYPSGDDLKTTEQLAKKSQQYGLTLHDHLITSENNYFSFRREKLI